jgi:thiol-disulfide isomerase/thioredoxin
VTTVNSKTRSYTPWAIGAGVVLVALVGAIVIAATRGDDLAADPAAIVETNAVVIDGAALPELAGADTALGAPAPTATGTGFDGLRVDLLADGEPTVIGFFAHWCPVCQQEVDELSDHLRDGGLPDDVRVVAVSTGVRSDNTNYPPSAWFADEQWPAPVLLDDADNSLAEAYGLPAFPFWAAVDSDGRIVARLSGAIGASAFDDLVDLARNGVPA